MHTCAVRCRGILLHENKLLVVKGSRGQSYYALPGGHLDAGEDPISCITRELKEELGIEPVVSRLLYVNSFTASTGKHSIEFFFEIANAKAFLRHEETIKTHAHEISEVVWMSPSDTMILLPEKIAADFREGKILSDTTRFLKD